DRSPSRSRECPWRACRPSAPGSRRVRPRPCRPDKAPAETASNRWRKSDSTPGSDAVASRSLLLELAHVIHQPLYAFDRHGVVNGGTHAAHRAMALQLHKTALFRAFEEGIVERFIGQREGHIHERAVLAPHGTAIKRRRIEQI